MFKLQNNNIIHTVVMMRHIINNLAYCITYDLTINERGQIDMTITNYIPSNSAFTQKFLVDELPNIIKTDNTLQTVANQLLNNVNQHVRYLQEVYNNRYAKPINGDAVIMHNHNNIGLYYDNKVYFAVNADDYVDIDDAIDTVDIVDTVNQQLIVLPGNVALAYFTQINKIKELMINEPYILSADFIRKNFPKEVHKPGCAYVKDINSITMYLYLGKGMLMNLDTLETQKGHVYIPLIIMRWNKKLLAYDRPVITGKYITCVINARFPQKLKVESQFLIKESTLKDTEYCLGQFFNPGNKLIKDNLGNDKYLFQLA